MYKLTILILSFIYLSAGEPISPIPQESGVNKEKALLGKELFFDTMLSRDNSTSCLSCHDVFNGGADSREVSIGFGAKEGSINSPTVLNARYNFRQFWNGRAKELHEQAEGPMNNPVEHNMDANTLEKRINKSPHYKQKFKDVYGVSYITQELVIDAIVEFEKALITPNSKFDRFLRKEVALSKPEKEGYLLFKEYGCITCHNGINIGGNSFQKMGAFFEYNRNTTYPDRYAVTGLQSHKNVFKVPTLRNIALTAPYFHDGSAKNLTEAVVTMAKHSLGVVLLDSEVERIVDFLETLNGELPKILESE